MIDLRARVSCSSDASAFDDETLPATGGGAAGLTAGTVLGRGGAKRSRV